MALAHNPTLQRCIGGTFLERMTIGFVSKFEMFLLNRHKHPGTIELLRRVRKERVSLQTACEQFMVHSLVSAYTHVPGDLAEVGVYQGCSAKLMCEVKGDKQLHLFDTYEGLPPASLEDRGVHQTGWYHCSLERVQEYLQGYQNVYFHKGLFPHSTVGLEERAFSFVHIDVDLYESTLACLNFFYPRMPAGGVILSHDYSMLAGVKRAFEEFCADKRERPAELPSTMCMLIKL